MVATAGLSLEQAPPIHLPLRFFLTAPGFAVAAGLLLMFQGEAVMASRWTPAALAVTHLLAIGFLGQIMCGALLQMLPVIAGAPVPGVRWVAPWTHFLLSGGAALLAYGFLGGGVGVLGVGAGAAALGFLVFLAAMTLALARAQGVPATLVALRLAAVALGLTVLFGLALTAALLGWLTLPRLPDWVQVHLTWGLLGWAGLLIVGIGYQVVPLFQVTPPYPDWLTRTLVPALFLGLAGVSLLVLFGRGGEAAWVYGGVGIGFGTFALVTLWLQSRRARPRADATLQHWWLAMGSGLAAVAAWSVQGPPELLGVLLLVGVEVGLPSGMLLKIVPFLCWFHLQSRQVAARRFTVRVPHMHQLVPDRLARWHPPLHGLALLLLAAAALSSQAVPLLSRLGGLLLAVSALWLWILIAMAAGRYRRVSVALG